MYIKNCFEFSNLLPNVYFKSFAKLGPNFKAFLTYLLITNLFIAGQPILEAFITQVFVGKLHFRVQTFY